MYAHCISTMPISLCILTLIIFTFLCQTSGNSPDRSILLHLKKHFSNSPNISHHWTSSSHHCTWLGITCRNGVVTKIQLGSLIINETIPPFICDLKNLTHLDINNNNIPGSFPTFLYNCSKLQYLDLSFNNISGIIPDDISLLFPRLEALNLTSNWFVGGVPAGIEGLKALKELQLADLFTNGSFPPEIGNLLNLEVLVLSQNSFSPQEIPPSFIQLKKLRHLWMKEAELIGKIPENISSMEALEYLDLCKNYLSGNIPSDLFLLKNLTTVFLYTNRLSGPIPRPVMALNLNVIDFSNNSLTGSIPEDFGKMVKLKGLALFMNQLSGKIPVGIGRLPALSSIELFMNNLSGELPQDFGRFSKLQVFDVSTNHLTGSLPDGLCENKVLGTMTAFDNNLTGELPKSLEDCNTLRRVRVERNNLSGTIPDGLWTVGPLTELRINNNRFTGQLPQKVVSNLSQLDISNNQFSGEIPPAISSWSKLDTFAASNNVLTGKIPQELTALRSLSVLKLDGNKLSGNFPTNITSWQWLSTLNCSRNQLSGTIPPALGLLPNLNQLDLSENQFSGEIPPEIGRLKPTSLNLSSNNHLPGKIPDQFEDAAFQKCFLNNPDLCATTPTLGLSYCGAKTEKSNKISAEVFAILVAFLFVVVILYMVYRFRSYKKRKRALLAHGWKLTPFHTLSFDQSNIVPNLREENVVGSGGSGKGYVDVRLSNGQKVGVKRIWSKHKLDEMHEKEFQAEVDISNNQFSGEIPSGISSWSKLDTFRASNNLLTGKIPQEFTALSRTEPAVREADEIPRTEETEIPVREDLLTELIRVTTWQKWRMSDLDTLEEGLPRMRLEEAFALSWLGTSSIPLATTVDEIHRVYSQKLAKREAAKGKAKVVEAPPTTRPDKVFTKEMRMAQAFSRFEAEFVDPNPQAGPSTRVLEQPNNSAREVGDDTSRADDTSWTSVAEAETLVTQPNQKAEEATQLSAKESTQEVKATEPSMPTLSPAREVEVPSSEAAFIVDFPSSSQTTREVEEPSGEQAGGVEVPSPAALQTREVEVEPTTTRTENLISVSIGQDRTPSPSPWLIDRLNESMESLKTMDEEQKNMFKMVKQAVEKSHKTVAETKSLVHREAHETKRLVQSHRDQFETSIAADQEFKSSVVESLIYFEMMTVQTQKLLYNVLCGLKQVFDEQANQQAIKGDTEELKEDTHRILGELHSKLQPSPLGHDGDDAKRGEERSQERSSNILGFPTPTSSRGRGCSERRSRTTINTNGEVVPYVPYEEGSGKRFRGENLSPRTKKWDNQRRTDSVFFKNQVLDKQRRRDENETAKKRQREEAAETERRIKARFDSLRRVTWNETDETHTSDQMNMILDQSPAEAGEQQEEQMCIG